jgi:hypothetical protein
VTARAPSAPPQVAELGALAVGAQVAGVILAGGYLLGLVQGPVIAVVGGLSLIAFGRAVFLDRAWAAVTGVAIAVLAGALGVGALRWDALELRALRGAQAVLGPTVLVGPVRVSAAAWLGLAAVVIAGVVLLSAPVGTGRTALAARIIEGLVIGLAGATVFWGPAIPDGLDFGDLVPKFGVWVLATLAIAVPVVGLSFVAAKAPMPLRWALLALAAALALTGAVLLGTVL